MNNENKYYVYGHYFKENNELFYIGKGTRDRATTIAHRSLGWKNATNGKQWYSVILYSGLSNTEANNKECSLIELLKSQIVNKTVKRKDKVDTVLLKKYLSYDPTSPTGLRWLQWNGAHNPATSRNQGEPAGSFKTINGSKTSVDVFFKGWSLRVHRVVWFLVHGYFPDSDHVLDHIDGNPYNNRIENLRMVSRKRNSENRAKAVNNSSGVVGVYRMNNGWGDNYIVGKVTINGKNVQKYFSEKKHGKEEAFRLACEWRKEQLRLLNEQGAGYTDRHGT